MGSLPFAFYGYALTCLAFFGLGMRLSLLRKPGRIGEVLLFAVSLQAAWAGLSAASLAGAQPAGIAAGLVEPLRTLAWIGCVLGWARMRRPGDTKASASWLTRLVWPTLGFALVLAVASMLVVPGLLPSNARWALPGTLAALGLFLALQVHRSAAVHQQWPITLPLLAMAGLFGFDLVLYVQAWMAGGANDLLAGARGYANAAVFPLLAIAASRQRRWQIDLTVSRKVVYYTALALGAAVYLGFVAAASELIQRTTGASGPAAGSLFLFVAIVGLLALLSSRTIRARLRVLLAKNFFQYRYDYRHEWLRLTRLFGEAGAAVNGALGERAIEGLARLCDSSGGALWIRSDDGAFRCISQVDYDGSTSPISGTGSLARFLTERGWVISIPEWRTDRARYSGLRLPPVLTGEGRQWLIVPLPLHDKLLGFVVLNEPLAPIAVDWEVRDIVKAAARQVATHLGVRQAMEALVQARQFESFNRTSAFVVHDLKNLVAQLQLIVSNAPRFRGNQEFHDDIVATVENVMDRMQGLLVQLRSGASGGPPAPVAIDDAIRESVRGRSTPRLEPVVEIEPSAEQLQVMAHRDRLVRVVGHLVQNAIEAAGETGKVRIRARRDGDWASVEVADTGKGMSEEFLRDKLFRPFESTKQHGMGIGAFEAREYIREIGGQMKVASRLGVGTKFRLRLPLVQTATQL